MLSSLLILVSILFLVVRFETCEGLLLVIIAELQSLVLSLCVKVSDHGGTANVVLRYGYGQFCWMCL